MKYCPFCKTEAQDSALYCTYCGMKMDLPIPDPPAPKPSAPQKGPDLPFPPKEAPTAAPAAPFSASDGGTDAEELFSDVSAPSPAFSGGVRDARLPDAPAAPIRPPRSTAASSLSEDPVAAFADRSPAAADTAPWDAAPGDTAPVDVEPADTTPTDTAPTDAPVGTPLAETVRTDAAPAREQPLFNPQDCFPADPPGSAPESTDFSPPEPPFSPAVTPNPSANQPGQYGQFAGPAQAQPSPEQPGQYGQFAGQAQAQPAPEQPGQYGQFAGQAQAQPAPEQLGQYGQFTGQAQAQPAEPLPGQSPFASPDTPPVHNNQPDENGSPAPQPSFSPEGTDRGGSILVRAEDFERLASLARESTHPTIRLPVKRGLAKMVFLGLVTLGIYPLVILCRISGEMNIIASRHDGRRTLSYIAMLTLAPFTLGVLPFVWFHCLSSRIGQELYRRKIDYSFGPSVFWLWGVLGAFILVGPFIYCYKLMRAMNLLNADYNANG